MRGKTINILKKLIDRKYINRKPLNERSGKLLEG
jgi:hypothetical protein